METAPIPYFSLLSAESFPRKLFLLQDVAVLAPSSYTVTPSAYAQTFSDDEKPCVHISFLPLSVAMSLGGERESQSIEPHTFAGAEKVCRSSESDLSES